MGTSVDGVAAITSQTDSGVRAVNAVGSAGRSDGCPILIEPRIWKTAGSVEISVVGRLATSAGRVASASLAGVEAVFAHLD